MWGEGRAAAMGKTPAEVTAECEELAAEKATEWDFACACGAAVCVR